MTRRLRLAVAAAVVGLLLFPAPGTARTRKPLPKLDLALREAAGRGSGPQRVIVRTKPGMRALLRQALESHGDAVGADHPMIGAFSAEVHGIDLEALADDPAVESVSIDAVVRAGGRRERVVTRLPKGARALSTLRETLGLTASGPSGAGVGVAVIDSGIQPSADFGLRISAFYDFTQNGSALGVEPYDDFGHGTHVAGLIGGSGVLSDHLYRGVAPGVRLIGLKVLDKGGRGRTSDVLSAIEFAVANRVGLGIDLINLSLGHPIYESAASDPLVQAVERAVRAGIVVVASAGNYGVNPATGLPGYAGITSPGNAPSAITVGAVKAKDTVARSDDKVAAYSSRGPTWYDAYAKPDLLAPGDRLTSDAARGGTLYNTNQSLWVKTRGARADYMKLSGTSMAAGVVSGVAALVLEANRSASAAPSWWQELLASLDATSVRPSLPPNAVKAILQCTAVRMLDDLGNEYDSLTQGAGEVNGAGALQLAAAIDASVPVGSVWITSSSIVPRTSIGGEILRWSQNIVWGNSLVRGSTVFVNQPAWATSTVWGSNLVWGASGSDNLVWGASDNVVWGQSLLDNIVWGTLDLDNIVWGNVELDNIVWGNNIVWASNVVWGNHLVGAMSGQNILWGAACDADNVVWGNLSEDNIVWGYGGLAAASSGGF